MKNDRYQNWITEDYEPQLWYAALIAAGAWGYALGSAAENSWHLSGMVSMVNLVQFSVFLALVGFVMWLVKR